jgi:hypothetical protein
MAQVISLDERTHTYTVDGVEKPCVTDLCAIYGDDVDEWIEEAMDRAADRGVTLHTVLEMALRGEDYEGEYPSAYAPWVRSVEQYIEAHEIVLLAAEEPIYSPRLEVCGTPDLLCMLDGVLTLLDWKFVSSVCKPKVKAQMNGYYEIFADNGVFIEQMIAVQFTPDKPRPYPVEIGGDEWATALKVWEIKNRKYARGRIG